METDNMTLTHSWDFMIIHDFKVLVGVSHEVHVLRRKHLCNKEINIRSCCSIRDLYSNKMTSFTRSLSQTISSLSFHDIALFSSHGTKNVSRSEVNLRICCWKPSPKLAQFSLSLSHYFSRAYH